MGQLQPHVRKKQGKLAKAYYVKGLDFIITSIREGTHSPGSLHLLGLAFDYDPQNVPIEHDRAILGSDYDTVEEASHRHAEYDPHK